MPRLPTIALGAILSCAAVQAAYADDCTNKPGFPTHADVTRATGLAIDESADLGAGCVYASTSVNHSVNNQVQLMRAPGEPKASFDKMVGKLRESPGSCTPLSGVGNEAYLCKLDEDTYQAIAYGGDTLFLAMIASQIGMGPATAGKLPSQTTAVLKALVAK